MKLIGLTGGAGSGKSTVAEMLREQGAVVVDADKATHAVYEPGTPGFDSLVREWMAQRTAEAVEGGAAVVVQDVPLLFENNLERFFSSVVLVYVPEQVQIDRLVSGRRFTREQAHAVIGAQLPIEEKRGRAHHVINNSGTLDETRAQVAAVWRQLLVD